MAPLSPPHAPPFPAPDLQWREARPADFPGLAAFLSAAHPDFPVDTADLERRAAEREPGEPYRLRLARRGGEIVGLAETGVPRLDGHPGWLEITLRTRPAGAGGPLAHELLAVAEADARQLGARTLVSRVREDWWEHAFLLAHAYTEHDRMWTSTLDLRTLDLARLAPQEARAAAAGVQVVSLAALGKFDEAQQRRFYGLVAALLADVPSTTPVSVWPFEVWQRRAGQWMQPEGVFLAVAPDGTWVGLSELYRLSATHPGTLHNGLTGVLPPWRGRGLAYTLKLAAARAALQRGFTHARTSNHSVNRPMLAVNERLGFVRGPALVTLRREAR